MRCLFMRAEGPQEPPEDPHTARRSMRRIISDDDDRSPRERSSSNPEELANTMRTEDELRDQLFENPLPEPKPHRSVARNAPVGANPAYHLARKAAPRVYCCGCCGTRRLSSMGGGREGGREGAARAGPPPAPPRAGTWLARPQDVVDERKQAVAVGLDDCERTVCLQNVGNLKEAGAAHSATCGVWQYRICGVRCSGCSAFLGVKVKSLERLPDDRTALNPRNMHDLLAELFSDSRGVRTSPPVATWLQDVAQQQPLATATAVDAPARSSRASRSRSPTPDALAAALIAPGSRVEIEQVFLGTRYLRLLDAHTQRRANPRLEPRAPAPTARRRSLCEGCSPRMPCSASLQAGERGGATAVQGVRRQPVVHRPAAVHQAPLGLWQHAAQLRVLRELARAGQLHGARRVRGAPRAGADGHGRRPLQVRQAGGLPLLPRQDADGAQPEPDRALRPRRVVLHQGAVPARAPRRLWPEQPRPPAPPPTQRRIVGLGGRPTPTPHPPDR